MNEQQRSVRDVLAERAKQRDRWGDQHDDGHADGDLAIAAAFLIDPPEAQQIDEADYDDEELGWAVRLKAKHLNDRRRQLVIGAALALAEIDRLDRLQPPGWNTSEWP